MHCQSHSDSPYGVSDLAGNVWEWVESVESRSESVYRGGSYYQSRRSARSMNRVIGDPDMRNVWVGMRICADAR